jgi:hypothetical protein
MKKIVNPSARQINKYRRRRDADEKETLQQKSLNKLFLKLCPENRKIEDVLLKVSALNDFYSTNIYDTYSVAENIIKNNIDKPLAAGKLDIVNKIAKVSVKRKTINFYSFATKYCSHHRSRFYPIYDSYVDKMLWYYRQRDQFSDFKRKSLKEYPVFIEAINQFKKFYRLNKFKLRDIDNFLWMTGKEYFPNKY